MAGLKWWVRIAMGKNQLFCASIIGVLIYSRHFTFNIINISNPYYYLYIWHHFIRSLSWSFILVRLPKNAWNFYPYIITEWVWSSAELPTESISNNTQGMFDFPCYVAICISTFQFISTSLLPCLICDRLPSYMASRLFNTISHNSSFNWSSN